MTADKRIQELTEQLSEEKCKAIVADILKAGWREMAKQYSPDCLEMELINLFCAGMIKEIEG